MDTTENTGESNDSQMQGSGSESVQASQATGTKGAGNTKGEGGASTVYTKQTTGSANDGGFQASEGAGMPEQGDAQTWKPSYKYTVNKKEFEFDDFIKPIIKTKDAEEKLKELYQKAYGLDEVKTARETFRQQAEEWKNKYSQVEQSLQTLGGFVKKGDLQTFFQALNIPKDKIIQYAIEELKYQELPPEQRQALDAQKQQVAEFESAMTQNQMLQQQMAQMVQKQAEFELNQELAKPDLSQAIAAYDAQVATPGAFKAEVIRRGQYYEAVHKISPPASQLVKEVFQLIGANGLTKPSLPTAPQSTPSQVVQNQQTKPIITSFQGGGGKSPAKKVPTSIEELRKIRQQLTT